MQYIYAIRTLVHYLYVCSNTELSYCRKESAIDRRMRHSVFFYHTLILVKRKNDFMLRFCLILILFPYSVIFEDVIFEFNRLKCFNSKLLAIKKYFFSTWSIIFKCRKHLSFIEQEKVESQKNSEFCLLWCEIDLFSGVCK